MSSTLSDVDLLLKFLSDKCTDIDQGLNENGLLYKFTGNGVNSCSLKLTTKTLFLMKYNSEGNQINEATLGLDFYSHSHLWNTLIDNCVVNND